MSCIFCEMARDKTRIIHENDFFYARYDGYPVSKGHTLVIPKEHFETVFDLPIEYQNELMQFINEVKDILDKEHSPYAYNIGMNNGEGAGQTVMHQHTHIIPRYPNDVENPRGGVRHTIPGKGFY